jgi:C4-dicarboxylate-specific signal transduction histidine kinase
MIAAPETQARLPHPDANVLSRLAPIPRSRWFRAALAGALCLLSVAQSYALHPAKALAHYNCLTWSRQNGQRFRDLLETEVVNRTAELATANGFLLHEVEEHKRVKIQLKQRTNSLENEIAERKRMQLEVERVHTELVETSRQAGMAEVATGVLHNVGNVLNSVNVPAIVVADTLRKSKVPNLAKVTALLDEHNGDPGAFLTSDPRGIQGPPYLKRLAAQLAREQQIATSELVILRKNIEHIKDVMAMQQSYAKFSGVVETVEPTELIEDVLRINASALTRHEVQLVRRYEKVPPLATDRHKILQILINLIRNAKYACDDSRRTDKQMTLELSRVDGKARISVRDNDVGLHSGALAARELGGSPLVHSDGRGKGAPFTLELPLQLPPVNP